MRVSVVASFSFGIGFLALIGSFIACGESLEVSPSPAENDGAIPEGGGGPRCTDKTLFVSASTGNDGNDGCSSDKPLKTISAAIGRAKTNGATDHQAKVCAGVYSEPIILDHPLSIRGGYDCFNWKRADDFGSNLPANPETKIELLSGEIAFAIKSAAVTRATEIEGLTIIGPTFALSIAAGAAPTIQHCVVRGDTVGVVIDEASPSLTKSKLSAGMVPLQITKSVLTTTATTSNPLSQLTVSMFEEKENQNWTGIRVHEGSDVEILDSQVHGGIIHCPTNLVCSSLGVQGRMGSKVRIERSRIAAGEVLSPGDKSRTAAVFGNQSTITLINNMLHSGSTTYGPLPETQAVILESCPSPRVFNNTLFATGRHPRTAAITLAGTTADAIVQNNILGSTLGDGYAIVFDRCTSAKDSVMDSNAGVNVRGAALSICEGQIDTEIPFISAFQAANTNTRRNNVALVNACGTPAATPDAPHCTKCGLPATCVTELIAGWKTSAQDTSGLVALFSPEGWKLLPNATCRIARPSAPLTTADQDAFSTMRTSPNSIGAHEQDGSCTP